MGNPDSLAVAVCIRGLWGCCFSRRKSPCFQKKRRTPNNLVIFSIYPDPHSAICKSRLCFRLLFLPLFSFYEGLQSNRNPSLAVVSRELSSCFLALKGHWVHFLVSVLPPVISHQDIFCLVGISFFFFLSLPSFSIFCYSFSVSCLPVTCHFHFELPLLQRTRRAGPTRSGCQTGFEISLRLESLQHPWATHSSIWLPSSWYSPSLHLSGTRHNMWHNILSISSHPATAHLQESPGSSFSVSSNQVVAASTQVIPEPSFLRAAQTWLTQPLLAPQVL